MIIKQLDNSSIKLPAIGQGLGNYSWQHNQIDIIRTGIDLGMNFIDTAEGYDKGHSEEIVGKAVKGIRDKVIIGTKFSPEHNSYNDVLKAIEGSLNRLDTDYIDLYQLHWPNPSFPLKDTISAMERLVDEGKIRYMGVCNLSLKEFQEAQSYTNKKIVSLQIEYNLFDRSIEDEILPFCNHNKVLVIAYSPLDRGRITGDNLRRDFLNKLSTKYNITSAQIALRWLIEHPSVVAIPTTKNLKHIKENALSTNFNIDKEDIKNINNIFKREINYILPDRIRVSPQGQDNKPVYQTLEEAIQNKLHYVPSPIDLAKNIVQNNTIKHVRLIKTLDKTKRYDYDLVEGRIRYWAWVIAKGNVPIPAYIRENWP